MRLLISNPDGIGDTILRQPLYEALAKAGHTCTIVARPGVLPWVALVAPSAELLAVPFDPYAHESVEASAELDHLRARLTAIDPDLLVLAAWQRTHLCEWLVRALPQVRIAAFDGGVYPVTVPAAQADAPPLGVHLAVQADAAAPEIQKNRALGRALLGQHLPEVLPCITASAAQTSAAQARLSPFGLQQGEFWVAVVGDSPVTALRNWRLDRWSTALSEMHRRHGLKVVLVGSADELPQIRPVRDGLRAGGGGGTVAATFTDLTADELVGVTSLAAGYVGRDTGTMHLAAALGRPVVAVFGGGHWRQFLPLTPAARVVTVEVPCQGCGWICHVGDSYCVKEVPVEPVVDAWSDLVAGTGGYRVIELPRGADLQRRMEREAAELGRERIWLLTRRQYQLEELHRAYMQLSTQAAELRAAHEQLLDEIARGESSAVAASPPSDPQT
jgi:ADP-heptose:LPS heptosyltransferase